MSRTKQDTEVAMVVERATLKERHLAAITAYMGHDMGDVVVKDVGGWETEGNRWWRTVYVEKRDNQSATLTYTVGFKAGTAVVIETDLRG
jgi:hypothetical protein